jgi:hypothetical protein
MVIVECGFASEILDLAGLFTPGPVSRAPRGGEGKGKRKRGVTLHVMAQNGMSHL